VALTVAVVGWHSLTMLEINGLTSLKIVIFVLFIILSLPICLSFWTAVIGFVVQWRGGDQLDLTRTLQHDTPGQIKMARTAVVIPVYNEDPVRVFAGVKATYESLEQTGRLHDFDLFILSDSTDPDIWVREEMAFAQVRREVSGPGRLRYRHRRENVERKTGNIAEFCATWGEHYEYMIVFDADSVMTGLSLVNLVRLMEKHPQVGIIQAPPLPVNRQTLFGRLHQFATHAYSLIFITGLNFWQGGAGNYWGHNAIIRIKPFVAHCRLPKLPGKEPLGGSILSHDFIEAAFMRRAGWQVYLASELRGSYEELPSSLISFAARDRRWCQGNLQHGRLLFTPGFHLVNRVHLFLGIMSYVASPLWLLLLAFATAEGIHENLGKHQYFPAARSLFPAWHVSVEHRAILLFVVMMSLLLVPKALSWLIHLRHRERRAGFGGALKLTGSVVSEMLGSTLLAPNLAVLQAWFVISTLMGHKVKWDSQDRGEGGTSFGEAARRHWLATLLGVAWVLLLGFTVPKLLWWFSPVILGFLLAIPLSVWSSRARLGQWAKGQGLFLIPEELETPEVLQRLHQELARGPERAWVSPDDGLVRLLEDRDLCEVHLELLPNSNQSKTALQENHLQGLVLKFGHGNSSSLSAMEKRELLQDADSIRALQSQRRGGSNFVHSSRERSAL
jgi:membrane glycosyltransferase